MMLLCKLARAIRYIVISQIFHFCCFRAYIPVVKLSAVRVFVCILAYSEGTGGAIVSKFLG